MAWFNYAYAYLTSKEEEGQGMVEYGLIIALVSIVAIGILGTLGGSLTGAFTSASNAISGAGGGT